MRKARTRPRRKNSECRSIWIKVQSYTDDCTTASTISNQDNVEKQSVHVKAEEKIEENTDEKFSENLGTKSRSMEEQFDFKRILMSLKDLTNEINQGVEEVRKQCSNVLEKI